MSALAKALTRYSPETLNHYLAVWELIYLRLYYQDDLSHAENETLRHRYVTGRLQELVR